MSHAILVRRRTLPRLLAVGVATALILTLGEAVGGAARASELAGPLVPSEGALFGAYVNFQGSTTDGGRQAEVQSLEADLGRRLDIDQHYLDFTETVGSLEQWDVANERIPLISWHGYNADKILAGEEDAVIRTQAQAVKALGVPVFLRYGWEMDGKRNAWWVRSPSKFKASWRYLYDLFVQEGATNAQWVWSPEAWAFRVGRAAQYYPGKAYVDWIAADGYSWAGKGQYWHPFKWIFGPFYSWGVKKDKPLMVAEFGARRGSANQRKDWIDQARRTLMDDFPAIKAVVYFDSNARYDWRPNVESSAYDAFKSLAANGYFVNHNPLYPQFLN